MKNKNPATAALNLKHLTFVALLPLLASCGVVADVEVPLAEEEPATIKTTSKTTVKTTAKPAQNNTPAGFSQYLRGVVADVVGDEEIAAAAYAEGLKAGTASTRIAMRALEKHLLRGDVKAAIKVAKKIEKSDGNTLMLWVVLLTDALNKQDAAAAKKYLTAAKSHLPTLVQFHLIDAYMQLRAGSTSKEALKTLKNAEVSSAYLARLSYHRGRMALTEGQIAPAVSALEDAHKLEPGALFTARLLAKVYSEAGRTEDADKVYAAFKAKHPQALLLADVTTEEFLAHERALANKSDLTIKEDTAETLFGLSVLLWAQGAEPPARQFMALALHLWPTEGFMPYYAGVLAESAGQNALATHYYTRLLNTPGLRLAAASRLTSVYIAKDDHAAAVNVLNTALEQAPNNTNLMAQLAQVHEDVKNYRAAIALYGQMLTITDTSDHKTRSQIHFARGAAHERLGHYMSATKDLQTSLKLSPNNPMVMNYLGYMWVDAGMKMKEGLKLLQEAHKLDPKSPALLDSLGWAYYKNNQYAQALLYVQRAVTAMPEDGVLRSHLGDIYAALGNQNEARKHWELALEFGLDNAREAKHVQQQLGL